MELNPAQLEAVTTTSGPLLVLAGAGTGKTQVVTHRIVRLIRRRTRPCRILAVTFTNKAAQEMQQRAAALIGRRTRSKPEISTFHSLCVRILRRHARRLGYPTAFVIYDRGDQESVARGVLREIKVADAALRPGDLLNVIGRWKNSSIRPTGAVDTARTDREHLAAAAYTRYQKTLKAAGAVDFDDLLLCTEELFERYPAARRKEAGRFDHLLIDEYQDTNGSQYRIVKALAAEHRNLCVVGDDDQSIYGWRGAEVAHIIRFTDDWPEAKVVRLQTNYRSTRQILAWSNRLIAFNKHRHDKVLRTTRRGEQPKILQLKDEEAEARTVVERIRLGIEQRRRRPRDFAILFRTNEQPRAFEGELRRAKVPYVLLGSQSFYDRKEVRDVLAYLKLLVNPRDEVSLLRVINTPARGIGQTTVTRLLEDAIARGRPIWDLVCKASSLDYVPEVASRGMGELGALIRRHSRKLNSRPMVDVAVGLIRQIGYREELARLYPKADEQQSRWAAVEEVVNSLGGYCQRAAKPTLGSFLQEITLTGHENDRENQSLLQRNAVALMTLHAAKGLEFREVYMVGMEEGLLPHRRSLEADGTAVDEERRLCYVGITRAQRRLTLTLALGRRKWGKLRPTVASRFLYEITGQADNPKYEAVVRGEPPAKAARPRRGDSGKRAKEGAKGRKQRSSKRTPAKRKPKE